MNTLFSDSLKNRRDDGFVPVIPDIKCRSPKEGDLLQGRDPVKMAEDLAAAGAPALSVVTEAENFGGSVDMLTAIVQTTKLPVLRKDFISSRAEIKRTADAGAAAVLLISSRLSRDLLAELYQEALAQGIEPLVESHTSKEMEFASSLGASLLGVNNRDILQLEKDSGTVATTANLAGSKPETGFLISESAIGSPADVRTVISAGADAVLVGTALWQARDLADLYRKMSSSFPLLKICGLRRPDDVMNCLQLGVDIIGFVAEYPLPVPWDLTRDEAARLAEIIRTQSTRAQARIRSCLVSGGSPEKIIDLAKQVRPDLVQLHYRETMADTREIVRLLNDMSIGVIKTMPREAEDRRYQFGTSDLETAVAQVNDSQVYALLADIRSPHNASSSMLRPDLDFSAEIIRLSTKPVFIAGGIRPKDIRSSLEAAAAAGVDIMSGVETSPGIKELHLLRQAVREIRACP